MPFMEGAMEDRKETRIVRLPIRLAGMTFHVDVQEALAEVTGEAIRHVEAAYGLFMQHNKAAFSDIVMRRTASLVMVAIESEVKLMGTEERQYASGVVFNELRELRESIDGFLAHEGEG